MISRTFLSSVLLLFILQPVSAMLTFTQFSRLPKTMLRCTDTRLLFVLGLGCVALGTATYGVAKLRSWWSTRQDNFYMQQANDCLTKITRSFGGIVAEYEKLFAKDNSDDSQMKQEQLQEAFESKLRILAQKYIFCQYSANDEKPIIDIYLQSFLESIKRLQESNEQLKSRMSPQSLPALSFTCCEIESILKRFEPIYNFLYAHRPFFSLEQTYMICRDRYHDELSFVPECYNNQTAMTLRAHQTVMVYQSNSRDSFPYRSYLNRLAGMIKQLKLGIDRAEKFYPYSVQMGREKLLCLEPLRAAVASSFYYTDELMQAEKSRLCDEKTAAKNAKTEALNKLAHAKEQKALALQAHAEATRENTREMGRHATIIEAQTSALNAFYSKFACCDLGRAIQTLEAIGHYVTK